MRVTRQCLMQLHSSGLEIRGRVLTCPHKRRRQHATVARAVTIRSARLSAKAKHLMPQARSLRGGSHLQPGDLHGMALAGGQQRADARRGIGSEHGHCASGTARWVETRVPLTERPSTVVRLGHSLMRHGCLRGSSILARSEHSMICFDQTYGTMLLLQAQQHSS